MNCIYCGTNLWETSYGNIWCPNCGKLNTVEESTDDDHSYIG